MADRKFNVHINMNQNEIQNVSLQKLATAPTNPVQGQFYYNTANNKMWVYNGTEWVDVGASYTLPTADANTLGGVKIGTNINVSEGVISVNDATNAQKGVIQIATDDEVTAGTDTTKAVTPKQVSDAIDTATGDFITIDDITGTSPIDVTDGVVSVSTGYAIPTDAQVTAIGTALQPADIIDNLTSTAADKALSANQGKELSTRLANVESRGRFLSSWNCVTGKPATDPTTELPYAYRTGDYYIVDTIASTEGQKNYKPTGNSYTGAASTTEETEEVTLNSTYIYDGSKWILQTGSAQTVTFSSIAGEPTDNTNLATALNAKTGKLVVTNGALSPTGGVVTWEINHTFGTDCVCSIKEVATSEEVYANIKYENNKVTIKMNTTAETIAASTYKAVIVG